MGRRLAAFLLVWLLAAGCRGSFELFDEGASDDSSRVYRVRLEVTCEDCLVRWSVGAEGASRNVRRGWSHTERFIGSPTSSTYARLAATPRSGNVYRVAISVNGETVAEERSERAPVIGAGGFGTSLTVESPIPPPQGDRIIAGVGGR